MLPLVALVPSLVRVAVVPSFVVVEVAHVSKPLW
jgi:hypothetical protein